MQVLEVEPLPSPQPRPASPEPRAEVSPLHAPRLPTPDMAPLPAYEAAALAAPLQPPERPSSHQAESRRAMTPDFPSLDVAERSLSGALR